MTGDPISAEEASQLGMVNRVAPRAELESATLELARKIAAQPTMATKMVKLAVSGKQDAQGRHAGMQNAWRTLIGWKSSSCPSIQKAFTAA